MKLEDMKAIIDGGGHCLNDVWEDNFKRLLAVAEAAEMLRKLLDDEYGMDKTELTHVRWTLAALEAE